MKSYRVGIVGATGMVGQRFALLLSEHPWFKVTLLAASPRSAGLSYSAAAAGRWKMKQPVPANLADMTIVDAADIDTIKDKTDFVFCAVDMKKDEIKTLEEKYAKAEIPVISNNSAHRFTADVPMIIPEVNPEHLGIIPAQRARLGTKKGFIAVKSNCSIQSFVPVIFPLLQYGIEKIAVCNYQAISGAGKTFDDWTEMVDNIIPYIAGEEEKTEKEPLKILGSISGNEIKLAGSPNITAQCLRVPVTDGHLSAVFIKFRNKPSKQEIIENWKSFKGKPQELHLPLAPEQFLNYFEEENFPQTKLHRELERGMAVSAGRLREDDSGQFDYKFVGLSHNTLRGAAGGAVLLAELCAAEGLFG
jgi:aspartate-semialdehyde dehydrogenase